VEEASRRGGNTKGGAGRRHGGAGRPPIATCGPRLFGCLPESSHVPFVIFLVADNFHVYFALESFFLAFLEFTLENTEFAKLVRIVT